MPPIENGIYIPSKVYSICEWAPNQFLSKYWSYFSGNLIRKLSSASSLSSMEESYILQASLDSSENLSERRNQGEGSLSPYYIKSMTPGAFESALRQKEGELASYMSRLVCGTFPQLIFGRFMAIKTILVEPGLHFYCWLSFGRGGSTVPFNYIFKICFLGIYGINSWFPSRGVG